MALEFKPVDQTTKEAADKSNSIYNGNSPFVDGLQFTISGHDYVFPIVNGKQGTNKCPVLSTSVGNLFLSTLTRNKVDFDGKVLTPNGTFNQLVRNAIREGGDNGTILKRIEDAVKDKQLLVRRTPYVLRTKDGRQAPSALIEIDIMQ